MSDIALPAEKVRGRWIPWVFVGGMLLVVAVNMVLVWFALTTFTGVTVGQAYDRGRTYNYVIQAAERQESLGWRTTIAVDGGQVTAQIQDRDGAAVDGGLAGRLERPLDGSGLPLDFTAIGPGHFVATTEGLQLGQWDARLLFVSTSGERLEVRNRLVVR